MRLESFAAIACAVVVSATTIDPAWAGGRGGHSGGASHSGYRHHAHTRVFVGSSFYYGPAFYPYPYYYPAPVYVGPPAAPPVYIQQDQEPTASWYYCQSAHAYYPYVAECPEGWQPVVP